MNKVKFRLKQTNVFDIEIDLDDYMETKQGQPSFHEYMKTIDELKKAPQKVLEDYIGSMLCNPFSEEVETVEVSSYDYNLEESYQYVLEQKNNDNSDVDELPF